MFQINVCVLQASLVEEVISLSALERVRELTCVSVLAICLDSLHCQLLINNHSHKALEVIITDKDVLTLSRNISTINPHSKPQGLINFIVHNNPGSNRARVEIKTWKT